MPLPEVVSNELELTRDTACRYINTSTRKVNSNFEVLPAGTFGLPEQHAPEEPASTAASARSSFESQKSGRRKLQKKRTSSSHSKQGH